MTVYNSPKPKEGSQAEHTVSLFKVFIAFNLIATGAVFFLQQIDVIRPSDNWWVVYIFIPGAFMLFEAYRNYQHDERITWTNGLLGFLGAVTVIIALLFLVDPTWSFTRNWQLFQGVNWNIVWPLLVLGLGVLLLVPSRRRDR